MRVLVSGGAGFIGSHLCDSLIADGQDVVWREKDGIRIVILRKPEPFAGAMLAKTVYRIDENAHARKR